jgi:capsid protein
MIAGTLGPLFWRGGGGVPMAIGWDAGESSRMRKDLAWSRRVERDEEGFVAHDGTRRNIRLRCADLRRNMPIIAGACDRIGLYAAPIRPQARTRDPIWNEAAESFWEDVFSPGCDSRGRLSLEELTSLAASMRPTHGGIYLEPLADGTVRPIEPERIRQPQNPKDAEGFADGVRVDRRTGRVLSYSVHARDRNGGFGEKHEERNVPASGIIPVTRIVQRLDQVREIGDLASAVNALQDIDEANKYTLNTIKNQSQYIGMLTRASGAASNSGPRGSTPTVGKRQTLQQEWGMLVEGATGDNLDMKASPTPGSNHIPYMRYQLSIAANCVGLPYEFFTMDLTPLDYSRQKGLFVLVNYAFANDWHPWLIKRMLRPLWLWRIAMETAPGRALYPSPVNEQGVSEWDRVEWYAPPEVCIDRQEANQADIIEMQVGTLTLGQKNKRKRQDLETQLRARARELRLVDRIAAEEGVDASRLHLLQIPGQTAAREGTEPEPAKRTTPRGTEAEDR